MAIMTSLPRPPKGYNPFRPSKAPAESTAELQDILNNTYHHWTKYLDEYVVNPDLVPVTTYEAMYQSDETVFSGIEFMVMSALARLGEYTHENAKIEEFVRDQIENMEGTWTSAVSEIMSAWWAGYSVTEILWKKNSDGSIGLRGLQTLHPATVKIDIHRKGPDKNKPRAVHQFFRQDKAVELPLNKVILYSHNGTFGNPYGTSRLKRVYKSWKIKDVILKAWGLVCERYGTPYTIAKTTGSGKVPDPTTGNQISAVENMIKVTKALGLRGSAVIDKNDEIDIKYASQGLGQAFEALVAYCNKMIYRAIGLPSLIADNGTVGSQSLGKEHFKLFFLSLEKMLFEVIDVLIEQLIRPMIRMNFGEQDEWGTFVVDNFQVEDGKVLAETFKLLAESGLMSAMKLSDVNAFRERLGIELWTEEDLQSSVPPTIAGLTPDPTEQPTDLPTEPSIAPAPVAEQSQKRYSYSLVERRRNMRRLRKERWSSSDVDQMAEQLAQFACPA